MTNHRVKLSILILLVLITGCGDQRILERTGFIQSWSLDLLPDGKINYAISVPIANPDIKTTSLRVFLQTKATSSKAARIDLARHTNLLLVSGQLRTTLFGLSLAKKGIWDHLDTLNRDPTISEQVKLIVVNGNAGHLLEKDYKEYPRTGKYVDRLIQKESTGNTIPQTTIYSFTRDYYDDGIDPIVPIVKDAGDSIVSDGIALFKDDRYVGKVSSNDSLIFGFMKDNFKQGEIDLDLSRDSKENKSVTLSALNSSRKVEVKHGSNGQLNVSIKINIMASVLEHIGELKISNAAGQHQLEQEMTDVINRRAAQIVKLLQDKNTDSLGIGMQVRNSMPYSAWKKMNWDKQYPEVDIHCTINIKIRDHGFRR